MSRKKKKTYREEMLRTAKGLKLNQKDMLTLAGVGLSEEAGEVLGLIKKCVFHKHPLDKIKRKMILKELGDVRWYFELLLHRMGSTMKEVESINVVKLYERYPDGFTAERSINRKKEK